MSTPRLSKRGQERVSIPADFSDVKWYDKVLNPQGMINLASAENTLMVEEILEVHRYHDSFECLDLSLYSLTVHQRELQTDGKPSEIS